jgi:hypothetical protein
VVSTVSPKASGRRYFRIAISCVEELSFSSPVDLSALGKDCIEFHI